MMYLEMNLFEICLYLNAATTVPVETLIVVRNGGIYAHIKPESYAEQVRELCTLQNIDISFKQESQEIYEFVNQQP